MLLSVTVLPLSSLTPLPLPLRSLSNIASFTLRSSFNYFSSPPAGVGFVLADLLHLQSVGPGLSLTRDRSSSATVASYM